ncbi:MAG: M48 family metallopeptidase [Verrucomicrobiales bacterium]|nr:M48 family metallopeptidase [Verrucomicrobiales bacterium]
MPAVFEQLSFLFQAPAPAADGDAAEFLTISGTRHSIHARRNFRARRYQIYVRSDRSIRLTIPRRGSQREGVAFVHGKARWIEHQLKKLDAALVPPKSWGAGTEVLLFGESHPLTVTPRGDTLTVSLGAESFPARPETVNFRPLVEGHLRRLASRQLPPRVSELAAALKLTPAKITIRNQNSRWGSCSPRRAISLNWRLVQTPGLVRDYIIIHELCHLREMNHSARFWRLVGEFCPAYRDAEAWLKLNAARLGL